MQCESDSELLHCSYRLRMKKALPQRGANWWTSRYFNIVAFELLLDIVKLLLDVWFATTGMRIDRVCVQMEESQVVLNLTPRTVPFCSGSRAQIRLQHLFRVARHNDCVLRLNNVVIALLRLRLHWLRQQRRKSTSINAINRWINSWINLSLFNCNVKPEFNFTMSNLNSISSQTWIQFHKCLIILTFLTVCMAILVQTPQE